MQWLTGAATLEDIQAVRDSAEAFRLGGGWVNQAYSRLSTTPDHITDCKLDSVVYAGACMRGDFNVDLSCLGRTILILIGMSIK